MALLTALAANACGGGEKPEPQAPVASAGPWVRTSAGLSLRGETQLVGPGQREVRISVTVINASDRVVSVEHEPVNCSLRVEAFHEAARSGTPAWGSARWRRPGGVLHGSSCEDILFQLVLRPGESSNPDRFSLTIPVREILGDSLEAGRYRFAATLRLNKSFSELQTGEAILRR